LFFDKVKSIGIVMQLPIRNSDPEPVAKLTPSRCWVAASPVHHWYGAKFVAGFEPP